ncbi:MAG: AraC family transcriptional regulator [Verrucomicrobia bacterium]|nr:AraC family transcriptional regulator [Verrucomicrobiota bacterium]
MTEVVTDTHHTECIVKVLVYIEEHLDEELALKRLAKIAHISPYYFHRLFRAYMGETLAEYVKRLRVQRAEGRLQYSDVSITELALQLGYETPSAFTKVFNQVKGLSPRAYRKIMKRTSLKAHYTHIPDYVEREEEAVLFVRRVGDYNEVPELAFTALTSAVPTEQIKVYYSIALDDPDVAGRERCRFDACVSINGEVLPKGEVGKKVLRGGRFAVFTHKGPCRDIEKTYEEIFLGWYPTSNRTIADAPSYCEHINCDRVIPEAEHITKIYIPLQK